jgi:hypothetical protein
VNEVCYSWPVRARAVLSLLGAACAFACAPEQHFWRLPPGYRTAVVIATDSAGASRVIERLRPETELVRVYPSPADRELTVVGLSDADLSELSPDYDPTRTATIAFGGPLDCGGVDAHTDVLSTLVPPTLVVHRAAVEALGFSEAPASTLPFAGELVLRVPVDPDRCRSSADEVIHPFGAALNLLHGGDPIGPTTFGTGPGYRSYARLLGVSVLDPDHVVVASTGGVYVIDRARGPIFDPGQAFNLPNLFDQPQYFAISAMAADPSSPGNARRIAVVGEDRGLSGMIWELTASPAGVALTNSATLAAPGTAVTYDERGRLLIGGPGGALFIKDGPLITPHPLANYSILSIAPTADPSAPYVVGTQNGVVLIGDVERPQSLQEFVLIRTELDLPVISLALRPVIGGYETWLGTDAGRIFVRAPRGREFAEFPFSLPSIAESCGAVAAACGTYESVRGAIRGLPLQGSAILPLVHQCSGTLSFRDRPSCVRGYLPEGDNRMRVLDGGWRAAGVAPGRVVLVGEDFRVGEIVGWR